MRTIGTTLSEDRCETECIHPDHVRPLLGRTLSADGALRVGDLFGMLADPTRARILHALTLTEELCVCDLALLLGLSVSGLSHQLRLLRDRDAVARRKVGRIVYYRLADDHVRRLLTDALVHVGEGTPLEVAG
ncbi:MAG: metalloregulator ArsR/SmtB family transcription factor [Chloroflexi bacterium]|nr:metalloregulator ArsR/SmtB family transcription factor [Chloroflexota bacterium]